MIAACMALRVHSPLPCSQAILFHVFGSNLSFSSVNSNIFVSNLLVDSFLRWNRGVTNSPKTRTDFEIFTKFEGFHGGSRLRFHDLRLTRSFKACKAIQNQEQTFRLVFTKLECKLRSHIKPGAIF